ncbi:MULTISPECIES: glycosyltransferase [Halomonadaceae]|uniref:glycosyltransferase n=1 Tax=Halomonadaceae TaxID=28256 RepID=UPI0030EC5E49
MGNPEQGLQVPRVLFLIDSFKDPYAGSERQLYLLVEALVALGIDCHLVVLTASDYLLDEDFPCAYTVLGHTSLGRPGIWGAMYTAGRRFRAQGFMIAHTFFNDVSVVAPPMLRLAGFRTVISRRDMGFWHTLGKLWLLRAMRSQVAAWIANSRAVADMTIVQEWAKPERTRVIYNGFPIEHGASTEGAADLDALRSNGRVLVGLVANVRPIKRIQDLVRALAQLKDEVPALNVVLIGAGDQEPLRDLGHELGVGDRLHCLGSRNDVPDCLNALDIGVLCSESEGFSNALIEYMLAGLPVVCTEAGGNPEAVEHGETGLLYSVGDVETLATHLQCLAGDVEYRQRLGEKGRGVAQERFSMKTMVDAHMALYSELLEWRSR